MTYDYIVDASGGGDFRTVQEAIDAATEGTPTLYEKRIFVETGTYRETITTTASSADLEGVSFVRPPWYKRLWRRLRG